MIVNGEYCLLIKPKNLKNIIKMLENLAVRSKAYMEKNHEEWFDTKIILRIHVDEEIELSLLAPIQRKKSYSLHPFYIPEDGVVYARAKTTEPPIQIDPWVECDAAGLSWAVMDFNKANRFTKYHLIKIPKTAAGAEKIIKQLLKDRFEEILEMVLLKDEEKTPKPEN